MSDENQPLRTAISKKTRFEVFKRDAFKCQYCGRTPPAVTLEVDHIIAVSNGGDAALHNLLTSCFDCNRGKADRKLEAIPQSLAVSSEEMAERELQIKAYGRLLKSIDRRLERDAQRVNKVFSSRFNGWDLSESFIRATLKAQFLKRLPVATVEEAMVIACDRMTSQWKVVRYFCGICWNKVRGDE